MSFTALLCTALQHLTLHHLTTPFCSANTTLHNSALYCGLQSSIGGIASDLIQRRRKALSPHLYSQIFAGRMLFTVQHRAVWWRFPRDLLRVSFSMSVCSAA